MLCRNGSEFPQSPGIQNTVSQSVLELAPYASLCNPAHPVSQNPQTLQLLQTPLGQELQALLTQQAFPLKDLLIV